MKQTVSNADLHPSMKKDLYAAYARRIKYYEIFSEIKCELWNQVNVTTPIFVEYMRNTYGIDVEDPHGYITANFVVIDQLKYLLFRIKYGI